MTLLRNRNVIATKVFEEVHIRMNDMRSYVPAALVVSGMLFTPSTDLSIGYICHRFYILFGLE